MSTSHDKIRSALQEVLDSLKSGTHSCDLIDYHRKLAELAFVKKSEAYEAVLSLPDGPLKNLIATIFMASPEL